MVDKGGWRKVIQTGRPRTPIQPNTVAASGMEGGATVVTTGFSTVPGPADTFERRRSQTIEKSSWRKTFHGTRPSTPVAGLPTENDDTVSEHGHEMTPRRLKPKLSRYLSNYLSLSNPPKTSDFSEPWSEDAPPAWITPVDPIIVLQSVHSYLLSNPSMPLPVQHNSGLLVIFEHYRKLREQKELLDGQMKEVLDAYEADEKMWESKEDACRREIRRLELIIARGTSGMSALIKARQGSVVDRKRRAKKTESTDCPETDSKHLTGEKLDERIMSMSQKVLLQRAASPSGGMAALSRRFTGSYPDDVQVGGPSRQRHQATLARKVRSELDLSKIGNLSASPSTIKSVDSEFSEAGDPLPDEMEPSNTTALDARVEGEAYVALKELAAAVARRKGVDVTRFHIRLMNLLSEEDGTTLESQSNGEHTLPSITEGPESWMKTTPSPAQHAISPHNQLGTQDNRRRHFSFEPGDDQLAELNRDMPKAKMRPQVSPHPTLPLESYSNPVRSLSQSGQSANPQHPLDTDMQAHSKIPSPIMTIGRGRRDESISSLRTVLGSHPVLDRAKEGSPVSVLTTYRVERQGTTRKQTTAESRSSSLGDLDEAERGGLKDRSSNGQRNINFAVLAAARAANRATSNGGSESKAHSISTMAGLSSTRSPNSPRDRSAARGASENDIPVQRL
ncbi:hypothetical protein P154DRAFT_583930 [Amniculicola lignicola CBS 123094]|uniref:Uncharacterized protein n=1 Tax=Amniculicola lignicola CBS 123094 TaxID=1392246 RepID=A0A6A5X4H1_9PLEO|nr:hypothetical protein P154DRAFT_583930 [Amniculicola lignicola CBS 123094]